jgi:hypothetical protein
MGGPRIGDPDMTTAASLTPDQIRKLERIKFHSTRYEIELVKPDGTAMLVCYSSRRSISGLIRAIRDRWAPIVRAGNIPEGAIGYRIGSARAYNFENGTIIRFSGRTQRDAIMRGELPFIGAPD